MRNPNGYGSVVKLSGNRRRPYCARKTVGWNEKGHPIYKVIGYYADRTEAMIALAEFNNNPWDLASSNMTLNELFELWKKHKAPKLGISNQNCLKSSYRYLKKYEKMKYRDIKAHHMQETIDTCGKSYSTQANIKNIWWHLDKVALEYDVINKSYSSLLTSETTPPTKRERFSDKEIHSVWELYEKTENGEKFDLFPAEWVDTILILIYTGFRITELLEMKTTNIDLDKGTFTGGIKTAAGKNRVVPIHSLIYKMVEKRVLQGSEYFISFKGNKMPLHTYREIWKKITGYLDINKTPHEARHTFESLLDSKGANRKCIDLMMGHASKDIGNRIYNHKTLQELKDAIELITR